MVWTGPLRAEEIGYRVDPDPWIVQVVCCSGGCRRCRRLRADLDADRRLYDQRRALTDEDRAWIARHEQLARGDD